MASCVEIGVNGKRRRQNVVAFADGIAWMRSSIPASYAATVQTALGLHNTGLRIDDVDGDDGTLQLTLSVALGRLDVVAGTTGATAQGSGTADVVLSGTLAQVNRLLAGLSDSSLTYTYFGDESPLSDSLMLTAIDSGDGNGAVFTSSASTSISISADPLPPAISTIADVTIDEDGGSASIAFVLSGATTPAEDLVLAVTSDDETLIPAENIVVTGTGAQRFLTITPAADRFGGPVTITLAVSDGELLVRRTFQVNVTPVNDAPTFTLETYAEATLDSGPVSIADFAREISDGPFEGSQTLSFTLTSDNPELFTSDGQPTLVIDPQTGHATLTFTPQYAGGAQVTATIHDDGGTANGGQNSTTKTFWIEVVPNFYIAGGSEGGGNSGGWGYNWTPDLGVYYAVAVERPAELKVDVEETLELTDENRLRVGGNLPENAVVRVALRTSHGTLEFTC